MKKLLIIFAITLFPFTIQAACKAYLVSEHGEGDVLKVYKSSRLFGSCKRANKKCRRDLVHASADAVCITKREFKWKRVTELAHDIDRSSQLLHRDLENMVGGHDHNQSRLLRKLVERVHHLSESADELHEKVEEYRVRSIDTRSEYLAVKRNIKRVKRALRPFRISQDMESQFLNIKMLFKQLRRFY